MFHFGIENQSRRSCHVRLLRKKMARVLSRQRRFIRRKMTAQYRMSEKHASKELARVLSRQARSIRRKMTAQYEMRAKHASHRIGESSVQANKVYPRGTDGSVQNEFTSGFRKLLKITADEKAVSKKWRAFRPCS